MVDVKNIMKKYVITVDPTVSVREAAKTMTGNKVGSLVILKDGKASGIITSEDIVGVVANNKDTKKTAVGDLPQRKLITASPEESVIAVSRRMVKNGIKRMPVVDKGRLVGIVSDKEIMTTAPEMLAIISEKLRARIERVSPRSDILTSGLCENCENYSDDLKNVGDRWLCEDCR